MTDQIDSVGRVCALLALAEGSGRVEYKRSCLWPQEAAPPKVQSVLMRLANANVQVGGVVELGRENDGIRVGLVDRTLGSVSQRQLAAAEQTLTAIADRMRPSMQLRWQPLTHPGGITTILILVPGRTPGHWYQDDRGVAITGSASHPVVADPELLRAWALEDLHRFEKQLLEQSRNMALRNEYMLSHDGITSSMLAGIEPLPAEWEAQRRRELGWDHDS